MVELANKGDTIQTITFMGVTDFKITRVTKTLAMSRRDDGYEYKFKREISHSMEHPQQRWNSTIYKVISAHKESK